MVLDRYVRALHEGRYKYVPLAAPDCLAELEPLRRQRPDAGLLLPRTLSWVTEMLYRRSKALGLPRFRNLLTPAEHRLVERYARNNPDDPDCPAMVTRIRRWRDAYLRWGRDTLGFGLYLFQKSS